MRSYVFQFAAWFSLLVLGAISFLGEGLHCLPGCGHNILLPGGIISVGLGDRTEGGSTPDPVGRVAASRGSEPRVLAPDDCTICSLLAAAKQAARPVFFSATSGLVTSTISGRALSPPAARVLSFDARAPPA
ncbi:MAG: hypothetical protein GX621_15900 [Pirellulaceae bacterium]|nr:hypothetical protein [Pirellulaceae bacterium]